MPHVGPNDDDIKENAGRSSASSAASLFEAPASSMLDQLAEPKVVARFLGCSANRVRQLEAAGDLIAIRTVGGQRLFSMKSILVERERRRAARKG